MDRPFAELSDSGLLWLINRTVFHPRGYALAITITDGQATGWSLLGDGSEPWSYGTDENDKFRRAEATLKGGIPVIPTDPVELAQIAYQVYGDSTEHKNFRGEPMPTWDDLGDRIQAAWIAAAGAVADACREVP